jgi:hypothetical protein
MSWQLKWCREKRTDSRTSQARDFVSCPIDCLMSTKMSDTIASHCNKSPSLVTGARALSQDKYGQSLVNCPLNMLHGHVLTRLSASTGDQGLCGKQGDAAAFPRRCWFNNDPRVSGLLVRLNLLDQAYPYGRFRRLGATSVTQGPHVKFVVGLNLLL